MADDGHVGGDLGDVEVGGDEKSSSTSSGDLPEANASVEIEVHVSAIYALLTASNNPVFPL